MLFPQPFQLGERPQPRFVCLLELLGIVLAQERDQMVLAPQEVGSKLPIQDLPGGKQGRAVGQPVGRSRPGFMVDTPRTRVQTPGINFPVYR